MSKYLDLAGLTAYDKKIKEWFNAGIVDITNDAINALFPVVQPNNEIWYTSSDGNVVAPSNTGAFGANLVDSKYENGKGVITFDGPVTSIGDEAFWSRNKLTSIIIPNSVTSIGGSTFAECTSLISITIPESVTSIGDHAFYNCSLTSVTIPENVTSIRSYAFYNCSALTSITFQGTIEQWNSINKGEDWNEKVPATHIQCSDGQVAL